MQPTKEKINGLEMLKEPSNEQSVRMGTTVHLSRNWMIHSLYVRGEFDDCLKIIAVQESECQSISEYALYVKGLVRRQQGKIHDSLRIFQEVVSLHPANVDNHKQVARSLYLLGKYAEALEVYEDVDSMLAEKSEEDWEVLHNQGLCHLYLKQYASSVKCFRQANAISRQECNYVQLGKAYTLMEQFSTAIDVYLEALEFSPNNSDILTTIGLMYLKQGDAVNAFDYLGNSLTHDTRNVTSILAAGSIIQDNDDPHVALVKYRVALAEEPNSPQLWNNVGMCFFSQKKHAAAIAALKRALFLNPFDWIAAYNLGLVHLTTKQYTSAFHFFSASINLKSDFASSYMYLGIVLGRMNDVENAINAYERAVEMEDDYVFRLNYSITLCRAGLRDKCARQFHQFKVLWSQLDNETRQVEHNGIEQQAKIVRRFLSSSSR